jgi:hypothetical protein
MTIAPAASRVRMECNDACNILLMVEHFKQAQISSGNCREI